MNGHRAAVIGAAGALGTAICRAYAEAGASVAATDLDGPAAERLAASLPGAGHSAHGLDATDRAAVARAAEHLAGTDSVVYAAGIETTCDVVDTDWDAYQRVIAVNLHGAMHVAQAFGRRMVDGGRRGSFVFLSSVAGKRGEPGAAAYCASKFALLGVTETFAAEMARHGIRVNAICPGNVDSPMLRAVAAAEAERDGKSVGDVMAGYAAVAAERRLVRPEEVARVAVWLASADASGITGESINVDAGALTGG